MCVRIFVSSGNGFEWKLYNFLALHKEITEYSYTMTTGEIEKMDAESMKYRRVLTKNKDVVV
jgi:hypothetical protein